MIRLTTKTLLFLAVVLCVSVPHIAAAQLSVSFEQTPLFNSTNIAPGHAEERTVTVTNQGTSTEDVITAADNTSSDGLADAIQLQITATSSASTYFSGSFSDFFTDGEVGLGELASGESRTYTYAATFPSSTEAYQDRQMSFNLLVGFAGGTTVTDGGGENGGVSGGFIPTSTGGPGADGDGPFFFPSDFGLGGALDTAGSVLGAAFSGEEGEGSEATTTSTTTDEEVNNNNQAASAIGASIGLFRDLGPLAASLLLLIAVFFSWSLFEDYLLPQGWALRSHFIRNTLLTLVYLAGMIAADLTGALEAFWWAFLGVWVAMAAADYILHKLQVNWNPHPRHGYYAVTATLLGVLSFFAPIIALGWAFGLIAIVSAGLFFVDRT